MWWVLFLALAILLGYLGGQFTLIYGKRRGLYDLPGTRRSHSSPTPRGGGIGIALALLLAIAVLGLSGGITVNWALGAGVGLLVVSATGWWEDHRPLAPWIRLSLHAVAAAWLIAITGGDEAMSLGFTRLPLGPLGSILPFLGVLWLTNLYNFMDGIDTLATGEGIFAGVVMGAWFWWSGEPAAALAALAIAGACAGFLYWNLPPARVFMGDVGSTSLGFVFAALVVYGEQSGTLPALAGMVILGLFVFDATFTVATRSVKGQRWYTAHREHAYQYLVRGGMTHGQAGLCLMAINLFLVLPAAVIMFWQTRRLSLVALICISGAWLLWLWARKDIRR